MESQALAGVCEMLVALIRSLVDRPEKVSVIPVVTSGSTAFRVQVAPSDVGKLIGTQGRTARALRIIVAANAARIGENLSIEIVNPERTGVDHRPFVRDGRY